MNVPIDSCYSSIYLRKMKGRFRRASWRHRWRCRPVPAWAASGAPAARYIRSRDALRAVTSSYTAARWDSRWRGRALYDAERSAVPCSWTYQCIGVTRLLSPYLLPYLYLFILANWAMRIYIQMIKNTMFWICMVQEGDAAHLHVTTKNTNKLTQKNTYDGEEIP